MANKYEKFFDFLIRNLRFRDFYYIPNCNDALHNDDGDYIWIGAMERLMSSEKCHYEFVIMKDKNTNKPKLYVMLHFEGSVYKSKNPFPNLIDTLKSLGLEQYRADNNVKPLWFYKTNTELDVSSNIGTSESFLKSISDKVNDVLDDLDKTIRG